MDPWLVRLPTLAGAASAAVFVLSAPRAACQNGKHEQGRLIAGERQMGAGGSILPLPGWPIGEGDTKDDN